MTLTIKKLVESITLKDVITYLEKHKWVEYKTSWDDVFVYRLLKNKRDIRVVLPKTETDKRWRILLSGVLAVLAVCEKRSREDIVLSIATQNKKLVEN